MFGNWGRKNETRELCAKQALHAVVKTCLRIVFKNVVSYGLRLSELFYLRKNSGSENKENRAYHAYGSPEIVPVPFFSEEQN